MPANFRHHVLWTAVWTSGAIVCSVSLVSCYILLASSPAKVVYMWLGFQIFWLLCRSLFFHVTEGTDKFVHPTLVKKSWEELTRDLKTRVLQLIFALCKHATYVHYRHPQGYTEDVEDLDAMQALLAQSTFCWRDGMYIDEGTPSRMVVLPCSSSSSNRSSGWLW